MPLNGPELGMRSPLKLRVGIDVPHFAGVNLQQDAAAIDPNQFQSLINVRLRGEIQDRGGQEKITTSAASSCVIGVFDTGVDWVTQQANGFYLVTDSGSEYYYNPLLSSTLYSPVISPSIRGCDVQVPRRSIIGHNGGNWYMMSGGNLLYRLTQRAESPTAPQTEAQPAGTANFASMHSWDRKLWFATTTGSVISWDTGTSTTESGVNALHLMDHAGSIYGAGNDVLKVRGASGTWSSISLAGLYSGVFKPTCMVSDGVRLYIGGWDYQAPAQSDPTIIQYDHQTATASVYWSTTFSKGDTAYYPGVSSMVMHHGSLWWSYPVETGEGDWAAYIGNLSDDTAVTIADPVYSGIQRAATQLLSYDGEFYAAVVMPDTQAGSDTAYLVKSNGDPSGALKYGDDVTGWTVIGNFGTVSVSDGEGIWLMEPIV